jgi:hypothetical protein
MNEIIQMYQAKDPGSQEGLTIVSGLSDLRVKGFERDEGLGAIIGLCAVKHDYGLCPQCHQISSKVHDQRVRVKRDLSVFGLAS